MRFPDCVAARRPLPAAIAWPDAMSGHFFGRKRMQCARRGGPPYFMPKRPNPFMPPMARIIFAMPPFFICFIMPCICSN